MYVEKHASLGMCVRGNNKLWGNAHPCNTCQRPTTEDGYLACHSNEGSHNLQKYLNAEKSRSSGDC